jgi:hypothetical protein
MAITKYFFHSGCKSLGVLGAHSVEVDIGSIVDQETRIGSLREPLCSGTWVMSSAWEWNYSFILRRKLMTLMALVQIWHFSGTWQRMII